MDIKQFQNYSQGAKIPVNLEERLRIYIGALAMFLEYLEKNKPETLDAYRAALKKKLDALVVNEEDLPSIPGLDEEIQLYNELQTLYLGYSAQLLEIPAGISSKTVELLWSNYLRSSLYPFYYRALTLCEVMGRDEAIEFLKAYIDATVYERVKPDLELEDLDHFWNADPDEHPYPGNSIAFRISKGKQGGKVIRCMGHELLKPFNDPELTHIVACYGDTAQIQAQNPNFVFTRSTTLAQGGPYCDNCLHDKRHVSSVKHPGPEFYENLGSDLEW